MIEYYAAVMDPPLVSGIYSIVYNCVIVKYFCRFYFDIFILFVILQVLYCEISVYSFCTDLRSPFERPVQAAAWTGRTGTEGRRRNVFYIIFRGYMGTILIFRFISDFFSYPLCTHTHFSLFVKRGLLRSFSVFQKFLIFGVFEVILTLILYPE